MKAILFFAAIVFSLAVSAQTCSLKTSIYFDTDSFKLTTEHTKRLDKMIDSIKKLEVQAIVIKGNTDADADSLYNIRLSLKRVTSAKNYFGSHGVDTSKVRFDYYGENKPVGDNTTDDGKQKNRRVDIVVCILPKRTVLPKEKNLVIKDTIVQDKFVRNEDTCGKDTTIRLPEGTMITMKRCEYLQQANCMRFTEYTTAQSLARAGLFTETPARQMMRSVRFNENSRNRTQAGQPLVSGGMLYFSTCTGGCLQNPITVRVPVRSGTGNLQLYDATTGGWQLGRGDTSQVKIVRVGRESFYEYTMRCPGGKNLDKPCKDCVRKFTMKLPKGYKFIEARLLGTNALYHYQLRFAEEERKSKTCLAFERINEQDKLFVKALDDNGDTVIMDYKAIDELNFSYKLFPGRCRPAFKKQCGNFLQVFGYRKSKFKITKDDFDIVIPRKPERKDAPVAIEQVR